MDCNKNGLHESAGFNRARRAGIIGTVVLLLLLLLIIQLKGIVAESNYPFFLRADLNEIYTNYKEIADNANDDLGYNATGIYKAEEYYKNMNHCHITGNHHQEDRAEFVIRFDRYDPDFENE